MLTFSFALALIQGNLTYTCPATRLSDVMVALSAQAGQTLKVTGALEGRFAVVRLNDTPLESALARFAVAFDGTWAKSGDVRILQPNVDPNGTDKQVEDAIKKYVQEAPGENPWTIADAEQIVKSATEIGEKSDHSPDKWKEIQAIDQKSPDMRLLKRIARSIGVKELTALPKKGRVVYSSSPTRMQRPFPNGVAQAINQYLKESALQKEALDKRGIDVQNPPEYIYQFRALQPYRPTLTNVKTAMLSLDRRMGNLSFELVLKAGDGDTVATVHDSLSFGQPSAFEVQKAMIEVEGDYKPSPDAQLLNKALKSSMGGSASSQLTPVESTDILKMFSDLEKNEMLRLTPSEVLLQTAEALDKDLVASLSDISIVATTLFTDAQTSKLQNFFTSQLPWTATSDEQGITVTSRNRVFGFELHIPRKEISEFVRAVAKTGVTIDALANLVQATPGDETAQFIVMLASIPFNTNMRNMDFFQGQTALRMYGKLDPQSKQKAKNGGYVANYGTLPAAVQAQLQEFIYSEAKTVRNDDLDIEASNVYFYGSDVDRDSTTLLSNGIPPGTQVTFRVKKESRLFTISSYGGDFSQTEATTDEEAASRLAWAEKSQGMEGYTTRMKFATGDMERLDVVIQFEPKAFVHSRFSLMPAFKDSQQMDLAQLPESVRKGVEEKLAKQREQLKDVPVGISRPPKIKP